MQIIKNNASVCKTTRMIIEGFFPNFFWTPCVVHTLNLALKNICALNNVEGNDVVYGECSWIIKHIDDVSFIKNLIMNHFMRLAIFNPFSHLQLLSIVDTRFAYAIVMMKRFKFLKPLLQSMVISEEWSSYKANDMGKAQAVKKFVLNDV